MEMPDLALWLDHISAMSPAAIAVVAVAGLVMGIAPSSLPLFSVIVGYVAGGTAERSPRGHIQVAERTKGLWLSAGFVLGMATVDAAIGALFGFLGFAVIRVLAGYLALTNLLLALLLVILGLALLRKIRIVTPVLRPALRRIDTFKGAYLLGVPFGLSACPACTPMLLPILGAAAASGSPWWGALLLFIFGIARGVPLLVAGAAAGALTGLERFARWVPTIERVSGILLLIAALYFLYQSGAAAGFVPPLAFLLEPHA
jgi:cytochrome c-type biogenesis protein